MQIYEFKEDDARRFAAEQHIRVKTVGHNLEFEHCPYCQQTRKNRADRNTFAIDLRTGMFNCLRASCGAKGNMVSLSKDFNFSLGGRADEYYRSLKRYRDLSKMRPPTPKPPAIEYMASRGISQRVTELYNLTVTDKDANVLVFPFIDEKGTPQFIKYRQIKYEKGVSKGSKEWCEKNTRPILFGMNHCNFENKTLVMTEGQIDSMSCTEAGIENAVSVPTGKNGFSWVPYCWDFLAKFDDLIVFGDCEHGEITLLSEMRRTFHGNVKAVRVEDYKDCKDANEILRKYGKQAIVDAINNAEGARSTFIKDITDVKRVSVADMERIHTGLQSLDKTLGGFYYGQMILLTGAEGKGKSTLGSEFITFAISQRVPCFVYSGELPDFFFRDWLDLQIAGADHVNGIVSPYGDEQFSVDYSIAEEVDPWYRGMLQLYDNTAMANNDEMDDGNLLKIIKQAVKQYGCRFIMVDNLMTAMDAVEGTDQYDVQTKFCKSLAKLTKQFNLITLLIAHPRKGTADNYRNEDVSGSRNIVNLADVVMRYDVPMDAKDPDTSDRVLSITKNRLTGKLNTSGIAMHYQAATKRISDTDCFDWELGWHKKDDGFTKITDDNAEQLEIPFDL